MQITSLALLSETTSEPLISRHKYGITINALFFKPSYKRSKFGIARASRTIVTSPTISIFAHLPHKHRTPTTALAEIRSADDEDGNENHSNGDGGAQ